MTNPIADAAVTPTVRADARRLLVASTAGAPAPDDVDVSGLPAKWLYDAAVEHRIAPALGRSVRLAGSVPESLRHALRHAAQQQRIAHLRSLSDLAQVQAVFERLGLRWAVAKGPVAAAHLWPAADMRQYTDVDIYVAPADFARALDALLEAGHVAVDRNWREMARQMRAEFALRAPSGSMIDLHWHIAVRPELRRTFAIDIDGMLDRVRAVGLGNNTYPTFDREDGALLISFHAAMSGGNRLMWLGDLWYATREADFSWAEFEARARRARAVVPVSLMCARMDALFGVQGAHTQLLKPTRAWARVARMSAKRAASVFLPGDPHADASAVAAARPTFAGSVAAAVHRRWLVRRGERAAARGQAVVNPLDEDVADSAARERYLEQARRSGRL